MRGRASRTAVRENRPEHAGPLGSGPVLVSIQYTVAPSPDLSRSALTMAPSELIEFARSSLPAGLATLLVGAIVLLLLTLWIAKLCRSLWAQVLFPLWTLLYPRKLKRRINARKSCARWVATQVRQASAFDQFSDEQFTTLEASVEYTSRKRGRLLLGGRNTPQVDDLSVALDGVTSLVVLEGPPGSGKSVALRHIAENLARAVIRHPWGRGRLPLYINLRDMTVQYEITPDGFRQFILQHIKESAPPRVFDYIEGTFRAQSSHSPFFLLLDSFDELPQVLGASDADLVIERYVVALDSWLGQERFPVVLAPANTADLRSYPERDTGSQD